MKYSNPFFFALTLALAALLTGCSSSHSDTQQQTSSTMTAENIIVADCIVSYFRQGQAPYMTEQQYRLDTQNGKLQIVANEPSGTYTFTLHKEQFTQSRKLTDFLSDLPAGFVSQPLATTVFYSFSASAGLLETGSLESGQDLKLEGRWYQPLQAPWPKKNNRAILLRSSDNNRIEAVGIAQFANETDASDNAMNPSLPVAARWLSRSYNLRYSNELDRLLPRKIDIFDIQKGVASKKLMVQIELKTIRQGNRSADLQQ